MKDGQKEELLLNLIFPDYPDGSENGDEKSAKEKETENSVSSSGCSYPPRLVTPLKLKANYSVVQRLPFLLALCS